MMKVCCPNCGQAYTPDQLADLGEEIKQTQMPSQQQQMMQVAESKEPPKTMVDAMSAELDDPEKAEARAKRKE